MKGEEIMANNLLCSFSNSHNEFIYEFVNKFSLFIINIDCIVSSYKEALSYNVSYGIINERIDDAYHIEIEREFKTILKHLKKLPGFNSEIISYIDKLFDDIKDMRYLRKEIDGMDKKSKDFNREQQERLK